MGNSLQRRKERNKASISGKQNAPAPSGMQPPKIENKEENVLPKAVLYKMDDTVAYKMEEPSPIIKHSGIGPANLGGPGMKSHVHACGTPKRPSGLNDGHSPIEFNDKLEKAVDEGKITGKFADAVKGGMTKMEAGSITMKPESDVEKYRKLDIDKS